MDNAFYTASSKSNHILVNGTVLISQDLSLIANLNRDYSVRLLDAYKNPIANAPIEFSYNGISKNANTDSNGVATITVGNLPKGEFTIVYKYIGGNNEGQSNIHVSQSVLNSKNTISNLSPYLSYSNNCQVSNTEITIKGIDRPAIAPLLPSYRKSVMLMDAGANTNCKPINLFQFAQMSTIYLRNNFGIERPRVGLLNIGTEETKGNDLVKESYQLLKEKSEEAGINFIGNIEGRDCFTGDVDVIITDGFTGNVLLKTIEGFGKLVKRNLKESLMQNLISKIGAIPALPGIKRFSKTMDYKQYGGALFLGVKKPVVKAHGSSDDFLFYFTIKQAENFVKSGAVEKMREEFEKSE